MEPQGFLLSGSRCSNLRKSFKLGLRPLLTALAKDDVQKAFSTCTDAERDFLHRLLIQVIKSLHENTEEEFEAVCQEAQVDGTLDMIDRHVEEKSFDALSENEVGIEDFKRKIFEIKRDELHYLRNAIQKFEEQNNYMKAHIISLKERQKFTNADALVKLKIWNPEQ